MLVVTTDVNWGQRVPAGYVTESFDKRSDNSHIQASASFDQLQNEVRLSSSSIICVQPILFQL